jgi:nucleotide-binding universal stress UspA family protein
VHAADYAGTIGRLAAGHDLIGVGARPGSRAGGIMLGSVASRMVHDADVPVLIARRPRDGKIFPEPILLATDGTPSSAPAATITARIARHLGTTVMVLHVGAAAGAEELREIARQTVEIGEATGTEPTVIELGGEPVKAILGVARSEEAALIVVGSRGRKGVKALSSTSERVAHTAPCSVLVARA